MISNTRMIPHSVSIIYYVLRNQRDRTKNRRSGRWTSKQSGSPILGKATKKRMKMRIRTLRIMDSYQKEDEDEGQDTVFCKDTPKPSPSYWIEQLKHVHLCRYSKYIATEGAGNGEGHFTTKALFQHTKLRSIKGTQWLARSLTSIHMSKIESSIHIFFCILFSSCASCLWSYLITRIFF
jgi:hypothetical protein